MVWSLVLALPLKGWSFAAMPCQMLALTSVMSQQSSMSAASISPCHDAMQDAGSDLALTPGDTLTPHPVAMMKACSLCMSGASLASLPPFVAWQPQAPLDSSAPIPFRVQPFVSHVPEGLDPPPRNLSL